MATSGELVLSERHGPTLVVTLNRPEKFNALSRAMGWQLIDALEAATAPEVRAVVITGAGRGFCAGVDLNPAPDEPSSPSRPRLRYDFSPTVLRIATLAKPVVAAVNGAAAGAGLGLACAADLRIASATATFVPAFSRIGSVPDMGTSYHLPQLIGYPRALDWLLGGETLEAVEAQRIGLVERVVPADELLETALVTCERWTDTTPTAVQLTKSLLRHASGASLAEQLDLEAEHQAAAAADPNRAAARARVADSLRSDAADDPTSKDGSP